ncbi:MAG TPA: hypothetical protein DCY35_08930 [Prolixibacteraceae bacterium]|nr:hypothetical protein [Prolixibacteraceae bacterium]
MMEKCTFCVQRIVHGRQVAADENRELRDGEVTPACVAACPSGALVFGDLSDPSSRVSRMAQNERQYKLMEELGTKPRVYYLPPKGRAFPYQGEIHPS